MAIFKSPREGKYTEGQNKTMVKHLKGEVDIGTHKIRYYNWIGEGSKILLCHGWESNGMRWLPYLRDFKEFGLNIFALDAPGHGASEGKYFTPLFYAKAINEIVKKEKIEIILGHSVGAYSTILYCKEHKVPQHLQKLLLLAPTGKLGYTMKQFYSILKLNKKTQKAFEKHFVETFKNPISYFDSKNLIIGNSLTGILIHDKDDDILPYEHSVEVVDNWNNGELVLTEKLGHRFRSNESKKTIKEYLKRILER